MADDIYTSIPVKIPTRERLEKHKLTAGEYWDDLINRLLDKIDKEKDTHA